MLKVYMFCLLSFVFGNSFLLATLTDEEIQKIDQEVNVKQKQIITALETKSYVEGINEVYDILCQPASVPGLEADNRLMVLLINSVLQWFPNILREPLPENEKEERLNQAILIDLSIKHVSLKLFLCFFKTYIGPFLVQPGITDGQQKEIVIDKLHKIRDQGRKKGIAPWLIFRVKGLLEQMES